MIFSTSEIILTIGFIGSSIYCMVLKSQKDLIVGAYRSTFENNQHLVFMFQHNTNAAMRMVNLLDETTTALANCRIELMKEQAKNKDIEV